MRKEEGFTLVELLVVMSIIGILAMMVIPRFTGKTKEAKVTATKADIKTLAAALERYESDNGNYPSTEQGLEALLKKPSSDPEPDNWKGPYVSPDTTFNDAWARPFQYKSPGDKNAESYDMFSFGPDKKEGTEDDIGNWRKE